MIEMKCVCGHVFTVGEMVHEISNGEQGGYQLLCDKCYEFYNTTKI